VMTAGVFTATIIFLFPPDYRVYAAAGFTLLYLAGCVVAAMNLKKLLNRALFPSTLSEFRKDKILLETLE